MVLIKIAQRFNPLIQVFGFNCRDKENDMKVEQMGFNPLIQVFGFNSKDTIVKSKHSKRKVLIP